MGIESILSKYKTDNVSRLYNFCCHALFVILPPFTLIKLVFNKLRVADSISICHPSVINCHRPTSSTILRHQQAYKTSSKSVNGLGTNSSRGLN